MKKILISLLLLNLVFSVCFSQDNLKKEVKHGQYNGLPRQDHAMKKWRANRFGQFIHWGLYSIPGGEWKGKTYSFAAEWLIKSAKIPKEDWSPLKDQFSIKKFDAKEWAAIAKEMGVKYVTLSTKHHEGFCLWPTKTTDYNIMSTPYGKDVLRELVDAYTAEGIDVNFYFSILEWHHDDWRYDIQTDDDQEALNRFKEYTKDQLVELATSYPEVKGFWFDGTWDKSWKKNGKFSYELEKILKDIRPGLIVSSRLRADEYGKRHFDSSGKLMGDYESGYERFLPDPSNKEVLTRDWEACMTIPDNQWGYHKDWSLSHIKSPIELIEMLVQCTSQNGNFLLNFGPMGNGDIRKEERLIAKEIGQWMAKNGEAIYGCIPADLIKQGWGYYTKSEKTGKVYMNVFNIPVSGKYRIKLNKGQSLSKAYQLQVSDGVVTIEQINKQEYFVTPKKKNSNAPFVIVIEIDEKESSIFSQNPKT